VLVSGHLDSWDVGQGAMDDGGGAFISWSVLSAVRQLGLQPKRTLRLVLWSCEEFGGVGADQYYQAHKDEIANMDLVMESDEGVFHPNGIFVSGNNATMQIMQAIGNLSAAINTTSVTTTDGIGTDVDDWVSAGVPGATLDQDNQKYFWFHHSQGDMMSVLDPDDVDMCAALWTITAYVAADLDQLLPR